MGRALKYLFRIAILAALGLVVYAIVADLPPPKRVVEQDLPMPARAAAAARPRSGQRPGQRPGPPLRRPMPHLQTTNEGSP